MRVIAIVAAVVLGVAAPALADLAVASPLAIDAARARVLGPDYQTELPGHDAAVGRPGTPRTGRPPPRIPRDQDDSFDTRERRGAPDDTGALGALLSLLMWGCVIVGVALAAFWLARELARYADDVELPPDDAAPSRDAETAAIIDRPLGDADELARRGEFVEAIHTLLLRTLQELVRSAAVRVERSHTSREILARVPLLADARDALAGLITAVEVTHFGDDPATAADYDRCRQQFHRFAEAFRASGLVARSPVRAIAGAGSAPV